MFLLGGTGKLHRVRLELELGLEVKKLLCTGQFLKKW